MGTNTEYPEGDIQRTAIFRYSPHSDRFVAEADVPYGHDMRLEWTDLGGGTFKPIYTGTSAGEADATSDPTWTITRFTWTDLGGGTWKPTQIRTRLGAWDNRAALDW